MNQMFENKIVYLNKLENISNIENPGYFYSRNEITYYNSLSNQKQMQSYIHMNDLIVPMLLKKDNTGIVYFAIQYTYISAKNKIFVELPAFRMYNKSGTCYTIDDIEKSINTFIENTEYKKISWSNLSTGFSPVSQSFTDQLATFVEIEVQYAEKKDFYHWYPISCLEDLFKRQDLSMSLQTKYCLLLYLLKHKSDINALVSTKFEEEQNLLKLDFDSEFEYQKEVYSSYRFGLIEKTQINKKIVELSNENKIKLFGENSVFATSKDSISCIMVKKDNSKMKVGLSKQQRSPFIAREDVDEYFYESTGGLVEPGESIQSALERETLEETGIQINDEVHKLCGTLLLSYATEENMDFYLTELKENYVQISQTLDLQENISEIEWFDLESLDINSLNAPIITKFTILLAKEFYNL